HAAAQLGTLAPRLRDRVEDLREIAADLPLDVAGEDGPLEVVAPDALGHRIQGVLHGPAEADLRNDATELGLAGLGDLLRDRVEGLHEAVPGSEGAREDHEHVGELAVELRSPPPDRDLDERPGHDAA